jgi:hypothetical protein
MLTFDTGCFRELVVHVIAMQRNNHWEIPTSINVLNQGLSFLTEHCSSDYNVVRPNQCVKFNVLVGTVRGSKSALFFYFASS